MGAFGIEFGGEGSRVFDSAASKTLTHVLEDMWAQKARQRKSPSSEQCSRQALPVPWSLGDNEGAIENPQDAQDPVHDQNVGGEKAAHVWAGTMVDIGPWSRT